MKIYKIILPFHEHTQFEYSNCEYIHHHLILNNQIKKNIDYKYYNSKYGLPFSNEEICNFITHKEAWRRFLSTNNSYCLILESNVITTSKLDVFSEEIHKLPNDWDVYIPYDFEKNNELFIRTGFELNFPNNERDLETYSKSYNTLGHSFYFISRSGATKMMNLNYIRQNIDDEFWTLSFNNKLNAYFNDSDYFDINSITKYYWNSTIKEYKNILNSYNTWTQDKRSAMQYILSILSRIATDNNIYIYLCFGSLLGYIRHGKAMEWDDDIDLAILDTDIKKILNKIKKIKDIRISKHTLNKWNKEFKYYKIWSKNGENIAGFNYTYPFIDLWLIHKNEYNYTLLDNIWEFAAIERKRQITFENSLFMIPSNYLQILDNKYWNWKKYIIIYPYCHRLERNLNRRFVMPIQCNEKGKLIKD